MNYEGGLDGLVITVTPISDTKTQLLFDQKLLQPAFDHVNTITHGVNPQLLSNYVPDLCSLVDEGGG